MICGLVENDKCGVCERSGVRTKCVEIDRHEMKYYASGEDFSPPKVDDPVCTSQGVVVESAVRWPSACHFLYLILNHLL